ncbi:MAG: hypothetical protein RR561_07265 [Peptostreptococcus sp.]|uniref:hypothetical protein n=1 Tax=Peptostreptococcus sp. TaxID=1262 RepID=UPI002FC7F5BA
MKKYLVLILLVFSIFTTGCSGFSIFGKEIIAKSTVYCDNCGFKSDKKTKLCNSCREKPIWLSKKPKITKQVGIRLEDEKAAELKKQKEKNEKESLENNKEEKVVTKTKVINKKESKKEEYDVCEICGKRDKISNLTHVHGVGVYVHPKCGENPPACTYCGNALFSDDLNQNGICDSCESSQKNKESNDNTSTNNNSDDSYSGDYNYNNDDYTDYSQSNEYDENSDY